MQTPPRLPLGFVLTTVCAGALLVATPSLAEDGSGPEHIRVTGAARQTATTASTATKTDTPLIETTQTVSVVTRAQMDERLVQTINEALRYTPGVQTDSYGADSRFDWFRIRGFDATTYGLYLDGMRFAPGQTGPVQEQYGLERIEVLDGPASVLYGQSAPGGLVNMTSKTPNGVASRELQFVGGSFDRFQGQGDLNGSIPGTGRQLDGRVVFLVRDADTQVDQVKNNRIYVAPSLAWHITPNDDLTVLSSYTRDHTSGTQFLPAYGTALPNPNGKLPTSLFLGSPDLNKWDRSQSTLGFLFNHRFNHDWSFDQNFRWLHLDLDWAQVYGTGLLPDDRTQTRYAYHQITGADLFTSDSRFTGHLRSGPAEQTIVAGLDYSRLASADTRLGGTVGNTIDIYRPVYTPQQPLTLRRIANPQSAQTGLYAQDHVKLFDHVILTAGGRFDWASNTSELAGVTTSGISENVFSYHGGAGYLFSSGLFAYADYSRSFQPTATTNIYGEALKPTYGKQIEVGLKYQPRGMDSFIGVSAFDLRQTNVATVDPTNPLNTIQTGEIRVRGIESSATMSLGGGADIIAAYTYLDPVITRANDGTQGKEPAMIPRNTASLWADYQFRENGPVPVLQGLGIGGGVRYVGQTAASNSDVFNVPSVTLFDAALHYDFGRSQRWRLGVNLNNVFDRTYVASCSGTTTCYYGNRRTVLGTVRVRW
ncbi:TonB-dependent siderophore receptor [Acetobacteraceae bacterium KSS8]|uniref:TonB-dependent siderophore receptor n=1 Tax=Endosaccharibacter trunci TaxID=2812733 RepID=A0ABT1W7D1_9PROT|nr:TonB-dependent siderophore receptor [Acetobacteraceae bacterium KSS8]